MILSCRDPLRSRLHDPLLARRPLTAFVLASSVLLIGVPAAPAAATPVASSSSNWAGYAVAARSPARGRAGAASRFASVSATWVQPAASCQAGQRTFSAFWVGLGGLGSRSNSLEQTGTEADCSRSGQARYWAWYELVPSDPVTARIQVAAGDVITATVAVSGHTVRVRLADRTRGGVMAKTLRMSSPDVSSADWIAEAPSACTSFGVCRPLPLTNFGSVTFSGVSTTTAGGHMGGISDPAWSPPFAISLHGDRQELGPGRFAAAGSTGQADPSALSSTGDSFSVTFAQAAPAGPQAPPIGPPGSA